MNPLRIAESVLLVSTSFTTMLFLTIALAAALSESEGPPGGFIPLWGSVAILEITAYYFLKRVQRYVDRMVNEAKRVGQHEMYQRFEVQIRDAMYALGQTHDPGAHRAIRRLRECLMRVSKTLKPPVQPPEPRTMKETLFDLPT